MRLRAGPSGARVGRGERTIDAIHPARDREPFLSRLHVSSRALDRRHALYEDRSRGAQAEPSAPGTRRDRPRRLERAHDRSEGPRRARLYALRDAAAAQSRGPDGARRRSRNDQCGARSACVARTDRRLGLDRVSRRRAGLALCRPCRGNDMGGYGRRRRIGGSGTRAADAEYRDGASRRRLELGGAASLRRSHDRLGGGAGDARAAEPGHDCRLARMRSSRAGPRGRYVAQHARTRTYRAVCERRRTGASALARARRRSAG